MALDFHRLDTGEHLFELDDEQLNQLSVVFEMFRQRTGLEIDPYKSMQLTIENAETLVKIIDSHILQMDLNKDKQKTIVIIGFSRLLQHFITKGTNFKLQGD